MQENELAFSAFLLDISSRSLLQLGVFIYLLDRQKEGFSCLLTSQRRLVDVVAQFNLSFAAALGEQKCLVLTQLVAGYLLSFSVYLSAWFHSLMSQSYILLIYFSLSFNSYSLPWYLSSQSLSLASSILQAYLYFDSSYLRRMLARLLQSTAFVSISLSMESVISSTLRSTSMSIPAIFCLRSKTHYCSSSTYRLHSLWTFSSSPKVCSLPILVDFYSPPPKNVGKCYYAFMLQLTVLCNLFERSSFFYSQYFNYQSCLYISLYSSLFLAYNLLHYYFYLFASSACSRSQKSLSLSDSLCLMSSLCSSAIFSFSLSRSSCIFKFLFLSCAISSVRYLSFCKISSPASSVCVCWSCTIIFEVLLLSRSRKDSASSTLLILLVFPWLSCSLYLDWQNLASLSIWKSALTRLMMLASSSLNQLQRRGQISSFHLLRISWMFLLLLFWREELGNLELPAMVSCSQKLTGFSMQLLLAGCLSLSLCSALSMQVFLLCLLRLILNYEPSMSQGVELERLWLSLAIQAGLFSLMQLMTYRISSPFTPFSSISHSGVSSWCSSCANSMCSRITDSLPPAFEPTSLSSSTTMIS